MVPLAHHIEPSFSTRALPKNRGAMNMTASSRPLLYHIGPVSTCGDRSRSAGSHWSRPWTRLVVGQLIPFHQVDLSAFSASDYEILKKKRARRTIIGIAAS